jgi:hypothetical protein
VDLGKQARPQERVSPELEEVVVDSDEAKLGEASKGSETNTAASVQGNSARQNQSRCEEDKVGSFRDLLAWVSKLSPDNSKP